MSVLYAVSAVLAAVLLVYLAVALMWPERFS